MLDRTLLFVAAMIAGFALLRLSEADSFLESLNPVFEVVGFLAALLFALVLIYKGIMAILPRKA
ncbi:hypothetical protein [Bacillus sp. RAR_GA_16]|uniref:hypothetical protein n=1 Tax=Bacillales TaxID=1385 RepID=UPI001CCCE00E|nr:hypothetical protein [Bacillus sp. RAR_GA_16]MCA0170608.1 hypothetical protein [Bacillus sp. RAR_GA_16]